MMTGAEQHRRTRVVRPLRPAAVASLPTSLKTAFQERAAIVEIEGGLDRATVGDCYGPDEVMADLKTVFTVDGPASHVAAERLVKAKGADVPAGDDLPSWLAWMNRRYVWRRGFSPAEAQRIVWGEAEWKWHSLHGPPPDPDRCAGCGMRILIGDGMPLLDGAMVHVGNPEAVECLAIYGAQCRNAASVGLMALGLRKPQS